jgi:hypothetical protein
MKNNTYSGVYKKYFISNMYNTLKEIFNKYNTEVINEYKSIEKYILALYNDH